MEYGRLGRRAGLRRTTVRGSQAGRPPDRRPLPGGVDPISWTPKERGIWGSWSDSPPRGQDDDGVPPHAGIRSSLWALPQTILRNTSAAVVRFSRLNVSRATHLPAIRAAVGLLFWLTPPPCPSVQPQSLPKNSLR